MVLSRNFEISKILLSEDLSQDTPFIAGSSHFFGEVHRMKCFVSEFGEGPRHVCMNVSTGITPKFQQ